MTAPLTSKERAHEMELTLRAALRHLRRFSAWDYAGSMQTTINRAERLLAKRGRK